MPKKAVTKKSQKSKRKKASASPEKNDSSTPTLYIIIAFVVALISFAMIRSKDAPLPPLEIPVDVIGYSPICATKNWLNQNGSLPGYHVLCVDKSPGVNAFSIEFFREGVIENDAKLDLNFNSFADLRVALERVLKISLSDSYTQSLPGRDKLQKWSLFTQFGVKVTEENWPSHFIGSLIVIESGQWIYPPIHNGFIRNITVENPLDDRETRPYLSLQITTLSCHPIVLGISRFIPDKYCDHFIELSEKHMEKSTISHMSNTKGDSNQWRTSSTHWLANSADREKKFIDHMDLLTERLTRVPKTHQEAVQVLRYEKGEQYDAHWDHFDEKLYRGTEMEQRIRGGMNRLATLFWYMSSVDNGGWTVFPAAGNLALPKSFKLKKVSDCNRGLLVPPVKGTGILFYSFHFNGEPDRLSLHGGCPVGGDETKWAGNKWIWQKSLR